MSGSLTDPTPHAGAPSQAIYRPEHRDVEVLTFASKAPTATGLFLADSNGQAVGSRQDKYIREGTGLYVVDCPLGWPGRLRINAQTEYELSPGMVIPDVYSHFTLVNLPAPNVAPWADSPVVLAVGPRGGEYRRPGWRIHFWTPTALGFPQGPIATGASSAESGRIVVDDYDWWQILIRETTGANPTSINTIRVRYQHRNPNDGSAIVPLGYAVTLTTGNPEYLPFLHSGIWTPAARDGAVDATQGIHGLQHPNYPAGTGGPSIPWGLLSPREVSFLFNNSSGVGRTFSCVAYAGVRVD